MRVTTPRPPGAPPLLLIFSITVTGILNNTLLGPAIPDILATFDQPASRAGLLVASGALPGIVVAPLIGVLADRFGRRKVLTPCLVVFGIGGGMAALAPSFALLLTFRLVQGVGGAGLINLAVVIIGDFWTGNERARLVGRNAATLTISLAIFPALGGLLTEIGGWRLSFAPYPLALVTALLVWRLLPEIDLHPQPHVTAQLREAAKVLRRPLLALATVAAFGVFFLIFGLYLTVLPVLLEDRFGLSAGARRPRPDHLGARPQLDRGGADRRSPAGHLRRPAPRARGLGVLHHRLRDHRRGPVPAGPVARRPLLRPG